MAMAENRPSFPPAHDFNDNWRVGGSAERLRATRHRALRSGVYANSGDLFVRWYQNERRIPIVVCRITFLGW